MQINKKPQPQLKYCPVCNQPMVLVKHIEDDGDLGSKEYYWECVTGCEDNEDKNYERV